MPSDALSPLRALLLGLALAGLPALLAAPLFATSAHAQDDDDDDDGDDDDDDGGGGGSYSDGGSGSIWDDDDDDDRPRRVQRPRVVRQPLLEQAPDEVVVEGYAAAEREAFVAEGFAVLAETDTRLLLGVPASLDVPEAIAAIQVLAPTALAAPNAYYRSQAVPAECSGALCNHWQAVGWPPVSVDPLCRFAPHIGVVDTGVNLAHGMLENADVTLETIGTTGAEPSETKHGTAVVALFVGDAGERVPGLAPAARLLVVDPFGRAGSDERSDVFALANALDRLGEASVDIASLSLAGPDNVILKAAVERLQTAGIPIVAAVGNAGPRAEPLFPAAYARVVGVTAVDGRERIYRRAVQGDHVAFAAPGVEITTAASISGVRPQTGTSFAVPFVTTALAAAMADGKGVAAAVTQLSDTSRDLGEPGRDPVFGWGLVQIPAPC